MNTVLFGNNERTTMSSLEIAELTGKKHGHVMRDTRNMLGQLGMESRIDEGGENVTYEVCEQTKRIKLYKLPIHIAATLVSRYDVKMAVKVAETAGITGKLMEALRDFDVPSELPDMYVYAIQEKETGRIKLGISKNPNERVKQLQTGNPNTLTLVGYHKAENSYESEKKLHIANESYRIRGEWFTEDAKLIQ